MTFVVIAGLFGALLGSFLNVVAYRLPQMAVSGLAPHGKSASFLAFPASHCPQCKTPIPPYLNIPVLGWLLLCGRARCCGKSISACYPLTEAFGGVLVAAAAWRFGATLDFALAAIFLLTLLIISVIDLRRYYILDILSLPLLWCGLLANVDARFALLPNAVLGAAGGYVGMRCIAAVAAAIFRKDAMGGGDFKLMAALGAWLGLSALPFVLFLAAVSGVCYSAAFYVVRRARAAASGRRAARGGFVKSRFSFGPALSFAGAIMLFWGDEIQLAYWRFIFA